MFGAVAAVYGYNRIARAVTFLGRRLLRIPIRNYFDDFYAVDSVVTARSGFEAFEELNRWRCVRGYGCGTRLQYSRNNSFPRHSRDNYFWQPPLMPYAL